jgi:cell division initiation protein
MRGFDPVEVEAFLEMVADEYESLIKGRKELTSHINKLEQRVAEVDRMEEQLQRALVEAQQTSTKTHEHSRKESDLLIREAELKAGKILEDSRREAANMKKELNLLKYQKTSFISRLKQLLSSQLELIRVLEMDETELENIRRQTRRPKRPVEPPSAPPPPADKPKTEPKKEPSKPATGTQQNEDRSLRDSPFAVVGGQRAGFDKSADKSEDIDRLLDEDQQDNTENTGKKSSSS